MKVSVVIVTHNRREALRHTLSRLAANKQIPHESMETLIVDNGSTDDTADMVVREYPGAKLIRRPTNEGVGARNHAFEEARGSYLLLIDDDSYPLGDALKRMVAYMDDRPRCGACVARVELLDGRQDASALPSVMINCATLLRKSAIDRVGGFPPEFFRQAEDYDLSFRLWNAGYRVERFDDVAFRHNRAAGSRKTALITRLDLRNHLIVLDRYVPHALRTAFRADWVQRYSALAKAHGHGRVCLLGRAQALAWGLREAAYGRQLVGDAALEAIFQQRSQAQQIADWATRHGIHRVAIADLSKNIYTTWNACREVGLHVAGVCDNHKAFVGLRYRGLSVVPDEALDTRGLDGIVLSNVNPAHVRRRVESLAARFDLPVLALWRPQLLSDIEQQRKMEAAA